MKKQRYNLLLPVILVLFFACIGFSGCEGPMGPIGPTGETGSTGAEGPAGEDGGNIPGGVLSVFLEDSVQAAGVIRLYFDPDETLFNSNESTVEIPLADYLSGEAVHFDISWRAQDITPGSYYVYAWVDLNGDSIIDTSPSEATATMLYDPQGFLSLPAGLSGDISSTYLLMPNYTFWADFAPQIDLSISWSGI